MAAQPVHEIWSSRPAFLLAAIGGAVGLGNVWKFPYMVGQNGGGAFVLVYLACVVGVSIPILMAEFLIGRGARLSPVNAMRAAAAEAGASPHWRFVGWLGMTAAFLIMSFYGPVASWVLAYLPKAASGALTGMTAAEAEATLKSVLESPLKLVLWNTVVVGLAVYIVARGIRSGIEPWIKFLIPALFVLLLVLCVYAAVAGDFAAGLRFLFMPDFSAIDSGVVLAAVGQAFLSIGIASGLMMTYGAYLPSNISIAGAAATISLVDTLVALLAGIAIFPIVFANGLNPAEGPGLVFVIYPLALGNMPGAAVLGTLFFVLLFIANLTSAFGMLETVVSWGEEHRGISRPRAAILGGIVAWLLGIGSLLSFSVWSGFHPFGFIAGLEGHTIFGLADLLITYILLPLGGLLIAVFVGWRMAREVARDELRLAEGAAFEAWRFLLRYLAPVALAAVLLGGLL